MKNRTTFAKRIATLIKQYHIDGAPHFPLLEVAVLCPPRHRDTSGWKQGLGERIATVYPLRASGLRAGVQGFGLNLHAHGLPRVSTARRLRAVESAPPPIRNPGRRRAPSRGVSVRA